MLALSMAGCSSTEEEEVDTTIETVNILCPTGAPGIALASVYEEVTAEGSIDFVDGSDELIANFTKEDSEYDIIIAPINVGCNLISKGQTDYRLEAVLTWGNLFLVGTSEDALDETGEIALFGQGAVPEKIYDAVGIETSLTGTYYSSATLVQQALLAGNVSVGMLAEPAATATIQKASENGITLEIIADMQELYGEDGYPQAAVFVKADSYDNLFNAIDEFTNNGYEDLEELLNTIGIETFNLSNVDVVVESIDRQNIHYIEASECEEDIADFLELFGITYSEDMLI